MKTVLTAEAERLGIDIINLGDVQSPPKAEEFPLYEKVFSWYKKVLDLYEKSKDEPWQETEAADELLWYSGMVASKTYRQLCNRWQKNKGGGQDFDYKYTNRVLNEIIRYLEDALTALENISLKRKKVFHSLLTELTKLKLEVITI